MNDGPRKITLEEWEARYTALLAAGMREPWYGGPLSRHVADGDYRLRTLYFDNSAAALRLWNFLLTEEDRLREARAQGKTIVGAMKDLGTVPVIAFSLSNVVAFYPDGAWWIPCIMELSAGLFRIADKLGVNDAFCPVRAMLGAFVNEAHFPIPDLLTCSVGATCDDFSAIAQRLEGLGHGILWWEIPRRRVPDPGEDAVLLPGGFVAPASQAAFVRSELERVRAAIETAAGTRLDDAALNAGIAAANRVRRLLAALRREAFMAERAPLPALEMLIAEMLAIHFCSDRAETEEVLQDLLAEVRTRVDARQGVLPRDAVRVFWVNPVADLRAMNLLEECGGRICGTEYLFCHALDAIPEDLAPMDALARTALADPMAGSAGDRAARICRDADAFGAEALVVSRIPGASHCASEGVIIRETVHETLRIPTVEIEVPPVCDALQQTLRTRIEALVETARARRSR
jgi:benzoyl-CoA reductase/2-hydroxyglutaryl-CoA dehydratase subunit BcrC/BadD/HgdB